MIAAAGVALASSAVLLTAAYLLWWLDRYRWEPLARFLEVLVLSGAATLLGAAFGWPRSSAGAETGGVAGFSAARAPIVVELGSVAISAVQLTATLAVVLLLLAAVWPLDSPVEGAIFGIAAGSGQAVVLSLVAAVEGAASPLDALARALTLAAVAAVIGAGLTWCRLPHALVARVARLIAVLAAAVMVFVAATAVAALAGSVWAEIGLAVLVAAGIPVASLAVEHKVIAAELAEEVGFGVLPPWVPEVASSYRRRVRSAWWPRRDERRALVQLLDRLALRKHQWRRLTGDRANLYSLEIGRLRDRARRTLGPPTPDASQTEPSD